MFISNSSISFDFYETRQVHPYFIVHNAYPERHSSSFPVLWHISSSCRAPDHFRWLILAVIFYYAYQKRSLTTWIMLSMLMGAEFGEDFPSVAIHLNVISKIFLNLIKTIIAPLLFGTLVVGIAGHSNLKQVGRMGWKSILYFEIVSTIALFIGLLAINISKAGVGVTVPPAMSQGTLPEVLKQTWDQIILHVFPENIAKSISEGQVLQIVVFSILFGIAVALVKEKYRNPMVRVCRIPFGSDVQIHQHHHVFCTVCCICSHCIQCRAYGDRDPVKPRTITCNTLYCSTCFSAVGLAADHSYPPHSSEEIYKGSPEPATLAFATTSSEAALPIAMENMEQFGVPRKIVAFVIPTGYSFNLDGTTLYLALASIFVAQISGVHLSFGTQLVMMITLMLTSKGVAAVPRASLSFYWEQPPVLVCLSGPSSSSWASMS